jgi:hypothetical protein
MGGWREFVQTLLALLKHLILLVVILLSVRGVQWLMEDLLWPGHDPVWLGFVRLEYVFECMDLMLIGWFFVSLIRELATIRGGGE